MPAKASSKPRGRVSRFLLSTRADAVLARHRRRMTEPGSTKRSRASIASRTLTGDGGDASPQYEDVCAISDPGTESSSSSPSSGEHTVRVLGSDVFRRVRTDDECSTTASPSSSSSSDSAKAFPFVPYPVSTAASCTVPSQPAPTGEPEQRRPPGTQRARLISTFRAVFSSSNT